MKYTPYMQPNIHCKVDGKLFAAVIDRQKIDISFDFKAGLAGVTLDSGTTFWDAAVPVYISKPSIKLEIEPRAILSFI